MAATTDPLREFLSGPVLSRRGFVQAGGALVVSLAIPNALRAASAASPENTSPDPALVASWLEIHGDGSILARTGRTETGTGMSGYYAQAIAEELRVRPEVITLITGDTDRTPDGGYSAGFIFGMYNVRKVAAYTREALLSLASKKLGVPVANLSIADGVVSASGKTVSYAQLVAGQQLDLKIPVSGRLPSVDPASPDSNGLIGLDGYTVTGEPPLTPPAQFKVMGKSFPMSGTPDKVTGKTRWSCDVTLPNMLHARMIRPATLGSSLVAVGSLDKQKFPHAEIVRKNNLLAVVSPNEWEAVGAARAVAASTQWSEWNALPGSDNLTKFLRAYPWKGPFVRKGEPKPVEAAFASAAKTISASYEQPYTRHAPIAPFVAVADVHPGAVTTVWTHSAQSQGLRAQIAHTLGVSRDSVVVRWLDQAGQYGRTTFGGDGAEGDAVILSQLTGRPVRVQWTLEDDLAWSTVSPGWVSDTKAALDANGKLTAIQTAFYSAHQSDARLLGAILAGYPTTQPRPGSWIATEWAYDKIPSRLEDAYGMDNLAADSVSHGLRGNIMRTPGQRQQNFALESLIDEAAAAVGADPLQFRLDHTTDARMLDILRATAKAAHWEPRPSPKPGARRTGSEPLTGRGICLMVRENAYWVGIAEISVVPDSGVIRVTKFFLGGDCGKILNPRQLTRVMKSGVVMGLSEALKEEVTFDTKRVTSTDWSGYRILTMQEMPEIELTQISRDDAGFGGGSEAANALVPPAVAAALFDATGVRARRIPLSPAYVQSLLKQA